VTVSEAETNFLIGRLLTQLHQRVDRGQGDRVAELFTPDAVVETPQGVMRGRGEIHAFYSQMFVAQPLSTLHFWTNLLVQAEGGMFRAETNTLVVYQRQGDGPAMTRYGWAVDHVTLAEGAPLFAARRLQIAFEGEAGRAL
jgi:ketosteroid isomerase-like protein